MIFAFALHDLMSLYPIRLDPHTLNELSALALKVPIVIKTLFDSIGEISACHKNLEYYSA
jgi:hypothetical protein